MSPIQEITLPPRSRQWTEQDAREALALLQAGKVAGYGEFTDPVDGDGQPKLDKRGQPISGAGRARSAGNALNNLIVAQGGERYRVTVRPIGEGKFVGALEPTPAKKKGTRQSKGKGGGKGSK